MDQDDQFPTLDRVHAYMGRRAGLRTENGAAIPPPEAFDDLCRDNSLSRETGFLTLAWLTYHARELHRTGERPGEYLARLNRPVMSREAMHPPAWSACCGRMRATLETLRDALGDVAGCADAVSAHGGACAGPAPGAGETGGAGAMGYETMRDDMAALEHAAWWWLDRLEGMDNPAQR